MERGNVWLSKKTATAWKLDKGKGDRTYSQQVTFEKAFTTPPKVFAVFSALDIVNDDDLRVSLVVTSTTTTGFHFEVSTWGATHVWSCAVGWLAFDGTAGQATGARVLTGRVPLKTTTVGWKLDKGSGARAHVQHIIYEKSFTPPPPLSSSSSSSSSSSLPMVVTGFCMLDVLIDDDDHHLKLTTKDVTNLGFDLKVATWMKTKVWGVSVAYIVFDPMLLASTGARVETGTEIITSKPIVKALTKGSGERKVTVDVNFKNEFDKVPEVLVFLSMQDVKKGTDHRIKVTPRSVTEKGFEVEVATWSDSAVYGCHVSWIAFTSGNTSLPNITNDSSSNTTSTTTSTSSTLPNDDSDADETDTKETKPKSEKGKEKKGKEKGKEKKGKEKEKDKEKDKEKETGLSGTKRKDTEDDNICKVCMDAKINTCLVPCGHLCLCLSCANEVKKQKEPCPICRGLIKQVVQTFA